MKRAYKMFSLNAKFNLRDTHVTNKLAGFKRMKILNYFLISIISLFFVVACNEGIDPITEMPPGTDASAPVITVNFPAEGTEIKRPEAVSSIDIKFEVTDDIELGSIQVLINGAEIASFGDFRDYRRAIEELTFDNVTNGSHVLTIKATDLQGKSSTVNVNFVKSPPYSPKYAGEIFYLPFDGEFMEMISFQNPTVVGNPGFSNNSLAGLKSYAGATDSYLTFPAERLKNNEMTAIFWMKINAVPDRAGILVMGPEDVANPTAQNNRTSGFRFFRENAGGKQRFKLNTGNGTADTWFDGGTAADVDPAIGEWVHFGFTISNSECVVYIDGQVAKQGAFTGIDWTGCDVISIMSGAPRFNGWNHKSDLSLMDELRIFNRVLSQEEIQAIITEESGKDFTYTPKYPGEIFYMPFEDSYLELVSQTESAVVGAPGFSAGKVGKAYAGAADSYLAFPADGLKNSQLSAAFWMKINATPDRAGILVMGPPDPDKPDTPNNRKTGFRFFREGSATAQIFKLNAGNGTADSWFDGGAAATVDPTPGNWVHLAYTISGTECVVYINGEIAKQDAFDGIDWTGCDILSIMSGAPRFTEWSHFSDLSLMDELRLFNKVLTQAEIQAIIDDEK